ncbi:hypothetical protein QQ045_030052 [Rhodiola kirilowii]
MTDDDWVVTGDFNKILHSSEIARRRSRDKYRMRRFRKTLLNCSLKDIGYSGPSFTFLNRRKGEEETRIRLDRVLANEGWMRNYLKAKVLNGWELHSDHRPVILSLEEREVKKRSNSGSELLKMTIKGNFKKFN